MAFRLPLTPVEAKRTEGCRAVDRMRAEGVEALKLLDGEAPSEVLHRLRVAILMVDDARDELRTRPTEPRALLDWLDEKANDYREADQ